METLATPASRWQQLLASARLGASVFGSFASYRRWLTKPAYAFNQQRPLDLLKTSRGIDLVADELNRIAHGDIA